MNLWDKALKLILVFVSASFFVACEEDLKNVGKDINSDQFDLLFKEFTLPSHVIIDSLSTGGGGLLTGEYVDSEFGTVSAEAYSAFSGIVSVDLTADDVVFDSLILNLKLAPYYYGAKTETAITFKIHELTEEITDTSNKTNFSELAYDPVPLGEGSFSLKPDKYDTLELAETDTLKIKLSNLYFQKLQDVLTFSDTDTINTTLEVSPETGFYGFAILASGADKVIGIGTSSQLTVHYHTPEADSIEYAYFFTPDRFNKITSDRTGTAIDGLVPNEVFNDNNLRYLQSGIGVSTELDFQPFLDFFADQDHVVINSVGLSLGTVESTADFTSPIGLSLINTDENSEISPLEILETDFSTVQSDLGAQLYMPYAVEEGSTVGVYAGLPTSYFQLLYNDKIEQSTARFLSTSVSGSTFFTEAGYTVDRFIVHQDSVKLKVYYTVPK